MATEYVVLQYLAVDPDEHSDDWRVIGTASGATPQAAIKAATDGKPAAERSGTFVAVPTRSWKPVTRRVQTVERDKWS